MSATGTFHSSQATPRHSFAELPSPPPSPPPPPPLWPLARLCVKLYDRLIPFECNASMRAPLPSPAIRWRSSHTHTNAHTHARMSRYTFVGDDGISLRIYFMIFCKLRKFILNVT
ncbi:unnamed protein product [Ceratitis capitata]|uniref:(Mediterranean fruit fly) hypothetical protein n=1 Tax=Ceratitis capitata TaxID=7213 RepID=A0A811UUA9_CERCA|nr:unnamed protein product [Ceratitis capitata]